MMSIILTPLDSIFALLCLLGLVGILILSVVKNGIAPERKPVLTFGLWMIISMGVVGFIALRARTIYEFMGGDQFIGRPLGDEALIGFLALVIGVPVALAGSVYAVMLAYLSVENTKRDRKDRRSENFDKEVGAITANFLKISQALRQLNADTYAIMESVLREFNELGAVGIDNESRVHFDAAAQRLTNNNANQLIRDAIGSFCDEVTAVTRHPPSTAFLGHLLVKRSANKIESADLLVAARLLDEANHKRLVFESDQDKEFLNYGNSEEPTSAVAALLDVLEIMRLQAARLTSTDMIRSAIFSSFYSYETDITSGEPVLLPYGAKSVPTRFGSWLKKPTSRREPEYMLHLCGDLLHDIAIRFSRKDRLKIEVLYVGLGQVILTDLHKILPTKSQLVDFLQDEGKLVLGSAWPDEGIDRKQLDLDVEYPRDAPLSKIAKDWVRQADKSASASGISGMFKPDYVPEATKIVESISSGPQAFSDAWLDSLRSRIITDSLTDELAIQRRGLNNDELLCRVMAGEDLALVKADHLTLQWRLLVARLRDATNAPPADVLKAYTTALKLAEDLRTMGNTNVTDERLMAVRLEHYAAFFRLGQLNLAEHAINWNSSLDWIEVIRLWIDGQMWRLVPMEAQDIHLTPFVISSVNGVLPLLLARLECFPRRKIRFWNSEEGTLLQVKVSSEFVDTCPFSSPEELVSAFDNYFSEMPLTKEKIEGSKDVRVFMKLDSLIDEWDEMRSSGEIHFVASEPTQK